MRVDGTIITNLGQLLKKYNVGGGINIYRLLLRTEGKTRSISFKTTATVTNDTTIDFMLKDLHEASLDDWSDLGVTKISDLENNTELLEQAKLITIILMIEDGNTINVSPNFAKELRTKVVLKGRPDKCNYAVMLMG